MGDRQRKALSYSYFLCHTSNDKAIDGIARGDVKARKFELHLWWDAAWIKTSLDLYRFIGHIKKQREDPHAIVKHNAAIY